MESSIIPLAVVMKPNLIEGLVVSSIKTKLKRSGSSISISRVSGICTSAITGFVLDGSNVAVLGLESKSTPFPT